MRVDVEAAVWICGRSGVYQELIRLLLRAATGQHVVVAGGDPTDIIDGDFFERAVPKMQRLEWGELLTRTLAATAHEPPPARRAVVGLTAQFSRDLTDGFVLACGDVGEWAEEKLEVLLENDSDWLLIEWAARVGESLGSTDLAHAITSGWIKKNGRGGTGELLKSVRRPPQKRCLVVADSDRDDSTEAPSRKARDIMVAGEANGIPVHVLIGRELENYVPEHHWSDFGRPGARRAPAQRAREVHLWGRVRTFLTQQRESLERKHSKAAFDAVLHRVASQAARQTSEPSARALLSERRQMSAEARAVDDLKARLGGRAAAGVARAAACLEDYDPTQVEGVLLADLAALAETVSEWL